MWSRPRFAYRALEAVDGKVLASYGLTSTLAGSEGRAPYQVINEIDGPGAGFDPYMFASAFVIGQVDPPEMTRGTLTFGTLDEAIAHMQSEEYKNAKRMITSLRITAG